MTVVNAICIRWGTAFGPEYVNNLLRGLRRHTRRDVRLFCMTDDRTGVDPDVECIDLVEEPFHAEMMQAVMDSPRGGPIRKISMFNPELFGDIDGPVFALDLDIVITGGFDDLLEFAPGKVCMRRTWARPSRWLGVGHGSVLRFDPKRHGYLYETIARNPREEILKANGSEQSYTSYTALEAGDFEPFPDRWIVSFKYDCRPMRPLNLVVPPRLPNDARVVCFHGRPKMGEAIDGYKSDVFHTTRRARWLTEAWPT